MPDYHHELSFGTFLFPKSSDAQDLLRLAKLAEEFGYDLIAAPDHPYRPQYLDGWTFLSAVFGATSSVRVFTDVINLSLRQPAVVAKSAWSLEAMAPGRLALVSDPVGSGMRSPVSAGRSGRPGRRICNTIMKKLQAKSEGFLFGPPEQWVEEISALAIDLGFDAFIFGDRDTTEAHLHRFAEEVVPGVRENVARARSRP